MIAKSNLQYNVKFQSILLSIMIFWPLDMFLLGVNIYLDFQNHDIYNNNWVYDKDNNSSSGYITIANDMPMVYEYFSHSDGYQIVS